MKKSEPATLVRWQGPMTPHPPPWKSLIETVPDGVPSLLHSPACTPSVAANRRRLPTATGKATPCRSFTSVVPAALPSLRHRPVWLPSVDVKKSVPATLVRPPGPLSVGALPGMTSLTILVPRDVPLLRHTSTPWAPSSAVK
jgi:hypothetical protein